MAVYFIAGSDYYPSAIEEDGNGFIEMDATVSLSEEFANSLSVHPVQVGADITDHVRQENNKFSVTGMISDYTPSRTLKKGELYTSSGVGIDRVVPSKSQQAYNILKQMRDNATLFTLVTQYQSFPNCVIAKITNDHRANLGGALSLSLDIHQIRIVNTSSIVLAINKLQPVDSEETKNNGTKSGVKTDDDVQSSAARVWKEGEEDLDSFLSLFDDEES